MNMLLFRDKSIRIYSYEDLDIALSAMNSDRYYGLNVMNLEDENRNTLEFRIPNGTIDSKTEKENIKLFGRLIAVSVELTNDEEKYKKYCYLKRHDLTERDKVEALLDLLFEDEEEKSIYRDRWDSVKQYKIYDEVKSDNPTFIRGDYDLKHAYEDCMEDDGLNTSFMEGADKLLSRGLYQDFSDYDMFL